MGLRVSPDPPAALERIVVPFSPALRELKSTLDGRASEEGRGRTNEAAALQTSESSGAALGVAGDEEGERAAKSRMIKDGRLEARHR